MLFAEKLCFSNIRYSFPLLYEPLTVNIEAVVDQNLKVGSLTPSPSCVEMFLGRTHADMLIGVWFSGKYVVYVIKALYECVCIRNTL